MVEPKISIIVPAYNEEKFLEQAFNSIYNQTFPFEEIELILIDHGSTDETKKIIQNYAEKYENISPIYLTENTGSPSYPRNIGAKHAKADYLMYLDTDDNYCENMCEVMYKNAIKYDADIVSCRNYDIIDDTGKKTIFHSILDKKEPIVKLETIDDDPQFLTSTAMLIWNKIYRKSLILNNNIEFPTGNLYEDNLFNIQAYIKANGIVFLNDFFGYNYQIRVSGEEKSISQDFKKENLLKFKGGLIKVFNVLIKENRSYPSFEAELLGGFMKWIFFTDADVEFKINVYNEVKEFYDRYSIFSRITFKPIIFNIIINITISIIKKSTICFKLMLKSYKIIAKLIYFKRGIK